MFKKVTKWKNKTARKVYLQALIESDEMIPIKYNKSSPHLVGQFLKHPNFGLGFIHGMIGDNKIQVYFEQFEKVLLQNWI